MIRTHIRTVLGVFLSLVIALGLTSCAHHAAPPPAKKVVQHTDILYDGAAQKKLVWDTCKTVYENQRYRYDSEIDPDGDRWDSLMYKAILARAKDKTLPYVQGDCEDTMWANARILFQSGFPADQLYLTYCHVPADQAGNYGGHAILIVLIEGMLPQVVEQLPEPRPLWYLIEREGYKLIAFVRFDENIKNGWNFFTDDITQKARIVFRRREYE